MSTLSPIKLTWPLTSEWWARLAETINHLVNGCANAVGTVTLVNGATQTTLSDNHIKPTSLVFLTPLTAHAAAVAGSVWIDQTSVPVAQVGSGGKITLNHSLIAQADCTFGYEVRT